MTNGAFDDPSKLLLERIVFLVKLAQDCLGSAPWDRNSIRATGVFAPRLRSIQTISLTEIRVQIDVCGGLECRPFQAWERDGIAGEGNLRDQAALQRGQTALLLRFDADGTLKLMRKPGGLVRH